MTTDELFIGMKRVKLKGKTLAQLEHMLFLAKIEIDNYKAVIANYPPERMERSGKPFLDRLNRTVSAIQQAIDES